MRRDYFVIGGPISQFSPAVVTPTIKLSFPCAADMGTASGNGRPIGINADANGRSTVEQSFSTFPQLPKLIIPKAVKFPGIDAAGLTPTR